MKVRLIVDYIYSRIDGWIPAGTLTNIDQDLKYRPVGYQFTFTFKQKRSDGYSHLFDMQQQMFRTGLLERVMKRLYRDGVDFSVVDKRSIPDMIDIKISLSDINPFQFQLDAVQATVGKSHSIIVSATGSGKSLITALLVDQYKTRTLVVVNSRTLLDQTFEFLDSTISGGVGIVGAGDFLLKEVTVATMQSLASILGLGDKQEPSSNMPELRDWLKGVGTVVHDEVHEADNKSVDKFYYIMQSYRFIGLTATPYAWAFATSKGKNLEMEQHFGCKVYDSSETTDLIALGLLVPIYVYRPMAPNADRFKNYNDSDAFNVEYKDVLKEQVVENVERHEFIAKIIRPMVVAKQSVYVYYQRIEYGKSLCKAMADLDPVMLQGSTSRESRQRTFKNIEKKKQLLVVSDIGSYGLNIRSLDSIVLATPVRDVRQLRGRVCRAFPGKSHGMLFDVIDRAPFLSNHARLRFNQYKEDKNQVIG